MTQSESANGLILNAVRDHPDLAAIVVAIVGLLFALVFSRGVDRLFRALSGKDLQFGTTSIELSRIASRQTTRRVVFWIVTLVFMLIALQVMSAESMSDWRAVFVDYGSRALLAFIILILGISLGALARDVLLGLSQSREAMVLARSLQVLVLLFAFATAFAQLGLDLLLFTVAFSVVIAVLVGAMGLAFALGSKDYVANLMARSELARISIGDRVRIKEYEGVVSQMHKLGFDLATTEGMLTIPAQWLLTQPYLKLPTDGND